MSGILPCIFCNEILYEIFENLSNEPGMLFSLLTLNSSYLDSVERLLYRDRADWIFFPNPGLRVGFLNTVNSNPRLASYVRSYAIIETASPAITSNPEIDNDASSLSFWKAVLMAVSKMSNLKVFILQVLPLVGVSNIPLPNLLSTLSKKQLVTFKWNADSTHLLSFLKTQPQLQYLHISALGPLDQSRADFSVDRDLPKLRHLSGDAYAIEVLMPRGRNHGVSSLACGGQQSIYMHGSTQTNNPVIEFPTAVDKLRSLAIHDRKIPPAIQTMCRDLVCLQIKFLPEKFAKASFPILKCIIFTGVKSMGSISQTHLSSIFSANPSLKVIYAGPLEDSRPKKQTGPGFQPQIGTGYSNNSRGAHFRPRPTHSSTMGSVPISTYLGSLSSVFSMTRSITSMSSYSQHNVLRTTTTMSSGSLIQGGSFLHGLSNTLSQVTSNNSTSLSYKRKGVEYPHIDTLCATSKYGSWVKKKKVNEDGVEVNSIISTGVQTIERSVFSNDLLEILWSTN